VEGIRLPLPAPPPRRPEGPTERFYQQALKLLEESRIPFLVGGAKALGLFAGIERETKDLDIFVLPADCPRVLRLFSDHGYRTELTHPHWLGKVFSGENFVDVIFSSGNGIAAVDEGWFRHSVPGHVVGMPVRLTPAEELCWSKGFVLERDRFDGADIAHVIRGWGDRLDWRRLLERFGPHWRVLFAHLVLYGFVYPKEQSQVPAWVLDELLLRLREERDAPPPAELVCRGTLLSLSQYLVDINEWGYRDPRLSPEGNLSREQVAEWTASFPMALNTAPRAAERTGGGSGPGAGGGEGKR
jgi:hypothetical protein